MIDGEYGNYIRITANEDISLNTNSIYVYRDGRLTPILVVTAADGLVLGATNKTLDNEDGSGPVDYVINEYVEYELAKGDIEGSGVFHACLNSLTPAGQNKIIGSLTFTVFSC